MCHQCITPPVSDSGRLTSLAALDGILPPAPHALAEALKELSSPLVAALALLAGRLAPVVHALAQVVVACMPEGQPLSVQHL